MKERLLYLISSALRVVTPIRLVVILIAISFFWFIALGDQGIYQLRRLVDMKHRLTDKKQALNDEIDQLTNEKIMLQEPANLEPVIRRELGFIKPGEVLFEDKSAAGERAKAGAPPETESERKSEGPQLDSQP